MPTRCLYSYVEQPHRTCSGDGFDDWYWDPDNYQCVAGYYAGCGPGGYGYRSSDRCHSECSPTPPRHFRTKSSNANCNLPPEPGTDRCANARPGYAYHYDVTTGDCKQFQHRGCDLNANNFATLRECKQRCHVREPSSPDYVERPPVAAPPVVSKATSEIYSFAFVALLSSFAYFG